MRLLRYTGSYVAAFLSYAVVTLLISHHTSHSPTTTYRFDRVVEISELVGSLYIVILFLTLLRKTSKLLERFVLVLTALFFSLFVISTLHKCGYLATAVPSSHKLALGIAWASTILLGICTLQAARGK